MRRTTTSSARRCDNLETCGRYMTMFLETNLEPCEQGSEAVLEKLWQWVADMQEQQDTVCLPLLAKLAQVR